MGRAGQTWAASANGFEGACYEIGPAGSGLSYAPGAANGTGSGWSRSFGIPTIGAKEAGTGEQGSAAGGTGRRNGQRDPDSPGNIQKRDKKGTIA